MGSFDVFSGRILWGGCLYGDIDHGADFDLGGGMFPLLAKGLGAHDLACFLGCLVACWWPMLDWLAVKDIIVPNSEAAAIVVAKPWYAGWIFKSFLALLPVVAGYAFKWKKSRNVQ